MNYDIYYTIRPLFPRRLQIMLRRLFVRWRRLQCDDRWPVLESSGVPPPNWPRWPHGKRFALVLTHDVETKHGMSRCAQLADLEEERGFRSAFAFIPLCYTTPDSLRYSLLERGFEIFLHGLYHDGKLYRNRRIFEQRRDQIKAYLEHWGIRGFASPSSQHDLRWISEIGVDFDISTYDVDPFEPQRCDFCRIFPFWVQGPRRGGNGFVELPYTLPQDFTLFVLMGQKDNGIWKRKLDWIAEKGGMALIKTHPDYMAFSKEEGSIDRYPVGHYTDFLDYVNTRYRDEAWIVHPSAVAQYWHSLQINSEDAGAIALSDAFCPACRKAHTEGRLNHYCPATSSVTSSRLQASNVDRV